MTTTSEPVLLDDDLQVELQQLAERSGAPARALANRALREYVRYENEVLASIEGGIADLEASRSRTTDEVLSFLAERRRARGRG